MLLTGSLFMTWFYTISPLQGVLKVTAFSTGFEFWVFFTLITLATSVALSISKPSRIGAVAVAWFGSWWFLLSVAAITSRDTFIPAVSKFYDIPNLIFTDTIFNFGLVRAHDLGEAWYVLFFASLLMLSGSVFVLREANRFS